MLKGKLIQEILGESKELILDSGVLIAYFTDENIPIVPLLDEYIFNEASSVLLYGHNVMKTELYYIICRKKNYIEATRILEQVDKSINIISEKWLFEKAGQIKCRYSISIADCFSISLGILKGCPILFLGEEELPKDVVNDINKDFNAKVQIII